MASFSRRQEQQKRTFLKFVNLSLSSQNRSIKDLVELSTGVEIFFLLKSLCEKLDKKFPVFEKLETNKIEMVFVQRSNVNNCVQWLKDSEKMPLHGIQAMTIVNKDMKIILGFVWAIILHFHVRGGNAVLAGKFVSPYKECCSWVNKILKDTGVEIKRLSDWSDGKPLFKVIESCYDNKDHQFFVDNRNLVGETLINNSIDFASEELQVPKILTSEEFLFPEQLSITAYISYFKKFKSPSREVVSQLKKPKSQEAKVESPKEKKNEIVMNKTPIKKTKQVPKTEVRKEQKNPEEPKVKVVIKEVIVEKIVEKIIEVTNEKEVIKLMERIEELEKNVIPEKESEKLEVQNSLTSQISEINRFHSIEMEEIKKAFSKEIQKMEAEIEKLKKQNKKKIDTMISLENEKNENNIKILNEIHNSEIQKLRSEYELKEASYKKKIEEEKDGYGNEISKAREKYEIEMENLKKENNERTENLLKIHDQKITFLKEEESKKTSRVKEELNKSIEEQKSLIVSKNEKIQELMKQLSDKSGELEISSMELSNLMDSSLTDDLKFQNLKNDKDKLILEIKKFREDSENEKREIIGKYQKIMDDSKRKFEMEFGDLKKQEEIREKEQKDKFAKLSLQFDDITGKFEIERKRSAEVRLEFEEKEKKIKKEMEQKDYENAEILKSKNNRITELEMEFENSKSVEEKNLGENEIEFQKIVKLSVDEEINRLKEEFGLNMLLKMKSGGEERKKKLQKASNININNAKSILVEKQVSEEKERLLKEFRKEKELMVKERRMLEKQKKLLIYEKLVNQKKRDKDEAEELIYLCM